MRAFLRRRRHLTAAVTSGGAQWAAHPRPNLLRMHRCVFGVSLLSIFFSISFAIFFALTIRLYTISLFQSLSLPLSISLFFLSIGLSFDVFLCLPYVHFLSSLISSLSFVRLYRSSRIMLERFVPHLRLLSFFLLIALFSLRHRACPTCPSRTLSMCPRAWNRSLSTLASSRLVSSRKP